MSAQDPVPERSDTQFYIERMRQLAEVGASLCCYMPGAGDPEAWPESRCDCKFMPRSPYWAVTSCLSGEQTGCCEVRQAWRVMDALRERAGAVERAADV